MLKRLLSVFLISGFAFQANQTAAITKKGVLKTVAGCCVAGWLAWRAMPLFINQHPLGADLQNEATRVLGYNPNTTLFPAADGAHQEIIITAHGWGDVSWGRAPNHRHFDERLRLLSFDFRDSQAFRSLIHPASLRFWNFGGVDDATAVMFHLFKAVQNGYTKVVAFGHSRGAASWCLVMHMLENPDEFACVWHQIGCITTQHTIDYDHINAMKTALKNGRVFLMKPLLSMKATLAKSFTTPGAWFVRAFLTLAANYRPFTIEPIAILERLKQQNKLYPTTIALSQDDEVVGSALNQRVEQLFKGNVIKKDVSDFGHNDSSSFREFFDTYREQSAQMPQVQVTVLS